MSARPVAYLRRSSADAGSPGDISREVQEHAVRELAARDGHNGDLRVFVDWARSADEEKEAKRTEFRAMLAEVEKGSVSTIYAYSLDRLARSTNTFARLLKAAKDQGVRVITHREGDLSDNGNPTSWAFGFLVSFFAEFELRMSKARAQGARERRIARGDVFGHAPFGYVHVKDDEGRIIRMVDDSDALRPVLAAVRDAGSVLGACRLLEQRGIPAPKGGLRWSTSALTRILERDAPELLPRRGPTGRRQPTRSLLAQLLKCHCGTVLTPNAVRSQYQCNRGHIEGAAAHGKYNVREVDLLPWLRAEAGRWRRPDKTLETANANAARRVELEEQRERLGWALVTGAIRDREAIARQQAELDAAITALDDTADALTIPETIDWSKPTDLVNAALRAMWEYVQLGPDMLPIEARWRVPEWRAD